MSWIKIRTNLCTDPRVLHIASRLEVPRHQAVGMLVELWSYADQHSTDGLLHFVSLGAVDALVGCEGFCDVLKQVGWVAAERDGVRLVRYEEHNGQTAKMRAQAASRAKRYRNASGVSKTEPREEERREEKSVSERKRPRGRKEEGWM